MSMQTICLPNTIETLRRRLQQTQDEKARDRLQRELTDLLTEQSVRQWIHADLNPPD